MSEPTVYHIKATKLVPNSLLPLLHFKGIFQVKDGKVDTTTVYDTFKGHGWDTQWVTRYGRSQPSHYHPETHECMTVLTGPGTIRFGVADTDDNFEKNTYGDAFEAGGLEIQANAGDAFIIPAGVAHKSYDPSPEATTRCYTGDAHGVDGADPRQAVASAHKQLSGFTMMGAYPKGCDWTWAEGGAHEGRFEKVWNVPKPDHDPFVGDKGGIGQFWN